MISFFAICIVLLYSAIIVIEGGSEEVFCIEGLESQAVICAGRESKRKRQFRTAAIRLRNPILTNKAKAVRNRWSACEILAYHSSQKQDYLQQGREERKWSLVCYFSAGLPHSDKARVFLLQIPAWDHVRQQQSFFGSNRRAQMTNDPIMLTP